VKRNKAVLLGTGASSIAMSSIEVFDGFSSKWGASMTDLTANVCGGLLFAGQELVLNKQIFRLKYSYHQTEWPKYRPDALGENDFQRVIKDYNGQTYWLSGNIRSLTGSKNIPSWLNFAIGYSGEAMCGGIDNSEANWGGVPVTTERYRQYYFSLDADLTQIKVKSKFMKTLFRAVNCIKIPFPALVLEKNRFSVNPLYF
jgi:hypothetical protein